MKRSKIMSVLVAVNLLLAFVLVGKFLPVPWAFGQVHRAGDYLQIPAVIPQGTNSIVYIIDASTGTLTAGTFDENNRSLTKVMQPVNLTRLFQQGGGAVKGVK